MCDGKTSAFVVAASVCLFAYATLVAGDRMMLTDGFNKEWIRAGRAYALLVGYLWGDGGICNAMPNTFGAELVCFSEA
eukprot:scaffold91581_cov34-Prasinocladus_malaysianus.AAC.1